MNGSCYCGIKSLELCAKCCVSSLPRLQFCVDGEYCTDGELGTIDDFGVVLVTRSLCGAYAGLPDNDLVWDGLPKKPTSHTQYNTSAGRRLQSIGVSNAPLSIELSAQTIPKSHTVQLFCKALFAIHCVLQ